jgi:hypothetical protein
MEGLLVGIRVCMVLEDSVRTAARGEWVFECVRGCRIGELGGGVSYRGIRSRCGGVKVNQ